MLALSEEEEEEEEGDEQSEEDVGKRPDAGEMRKGVEGERVVKSGYLLKKGERRKVGSWLGVGGLEVVVIASCADGGGGCFFDGQNWKKRWFVLRTEKMAYYKDERVRRCYILLIVLKASTILTHFLSILPGIRSLSYPRPP